VPPLYRKIADELRSRILGGDLRPGDRLPAERALMQEHGVSRNTVRQAAALLVNEGLVQHVPGRDGGMVVRERVTLTFHASRVEMPAGPRSESDAWFGEVRAQGHEPTQDFACAVVALPDEIAVRLGVPAGSDAARRRCVRYVDDVPSSVQDTYYPMDLCREVPELLSPRDIPQGTTQLLADRGHVQVAYEDEVLAAMPTPEEATLLGLTAGTPVLRYTRTGFSAARPIRVSVSPMAGDRNRIVYTLGDAEVIQRFLSEDL
jgi:GntR family transcriptional regulator